MPALSFASKEFIDYRDVVVDLTRTPLPADLLLQLAKKVRGIHSVARQWDAESHIPDHLLQNIVTRIDQSAFPVSKPRMVASVVAKLLESAEQNPAENPALAVDSTVSEAAQTLAVRPEPEKWD